MTTLQSQRKKLGGKEILVYASELAGFIGMHKFQSQAQVWNSIWDRVDNGKHKSLALGMMENIKVCHSTQEYLNELCDQSDLKRLDVKKIKKEIVSCESANDLNLKTMEFQKQIVRAKKTNPEIYEELKKILDVETSGAYGHTKEKKSIAKHEESHYVKIDSKNDKFYFNHYFQLGDRNWGIGGRIDGKIGETIVEVKNRKYKLFEKPPIYEMIQIECYMRLLNSNNAKLIQHLWKKDGDLEEDIILLKRNDTLWEDILQKMRTTSILFTNFLADSDWQKKFLECTSDSQRQHIIYSFSSKAKIS